MRYLLSIFTCWLVLATGCNHTRQSVPQTHCVKEADLPVNYARGFTISYYNGFKVITVRDVKDTTRVLQQYVLLPKGKPAPVDFKDAVLLDTPAKRIVCISTNHIAQMQVLGLVDRISGVANVSLLYDSAVRAKVKAGTIVDLGSNELNFEQLAALEPSFVFTYGIYDGGDKLLNKLNTLHIKSVLNLDYMEQDPLGRAEWIKFVAAFYNREVEADSIFRGIEANYLNLVNKAKQLHDRPTVFCNIPFKDVWYMPCGENYMARLIADAGGDFLWSDAKATNGLNLSLDYEAVYGHAANADIWLVNGFSASLHDIAVADKKNTHFAAFKNGRVYNNDTRNTPAGGFDFWESGGVHPDWVLADLIYIFHPQVLPGYKLYYYRKLN